MTTSPHRSIEVPAGHGKAVRLSAGQAVRVVNTHGTQVVDCWAWNAYNLNEYMCMETTRVWNQRLNPVVGDTFVTNERHAVLTVVEDTASGVHDTLIAACDRYRYEQLGCATYHDNCTDNLEAALKELGKIVPETPCPLNLFQNTPVVEDGAIDYRAPVSKPSQYIKLRCEMDLIIVFSACPQDILPTNGAACKPTDAHFTVD